MKLSIKFGVKASGTPEELENVARLNEEINRDGLRHASRTVTLDESLMRDFLQKMREVGEILNRAHALAAARRKQRGKKKGGE